MPLNEIIKFIVEWIIIPVLIVYVGWRILRKLLVITTPKPKEEEEEATMIYDLEKREVVNGGLEAR